MPRTAERATGERVTNQDRMDQDDVVPAPDRRRGDSGAVGGGPAGSGGGPLDRVTVNLTSRASRALELATRLTGDSKTDTINRALQIYAFLEETMANGGTILVQENKDEPPVRIKIF